jgi:hypothetical protein
MKMLIRIKLELMQNWESNVRKQASFNPEQKQKIGVNSVTQQKLSELFQGTQTRWAPRPTTPLCRSWATLCGPPLQKPVS